MNVSPVDLKHIHSSLFKKKESGISQKNKKKVKLKNIKKSILYYLISISMFCLIIVLDRIINKFITDKENFVIKALQEMLNINYSNQKPPLIYQLVASLSDIRYFVLLNTHIYIILYFGVDSFLSAKVMILHYLGLFFCYFLQILYVNPRPFWVDSGIVSYSCDGDFLLPNDFFFSYMFIFLYIFYNFRKRSKANSNENNNESFMETISENKEIYNKKNSFFHNVEEDSSDNWNESNELENEGFITKLKNNSVLLLKILIVIVFCLLVFYRYAMGVLYLESVVMSMVYCVLYFILVVFLDGYIEDFVKRSTIIASESKRNMFNWVIGIMLLQSLSFISYFSSAKYTDIKWLENYIRCPYKNNVAVSELGSKALGYWFSFVSSTIVFALVGSIFGVPKCYRLMNNVYWCETSFIKKVIRVVLASCLLIPSWIFSIYFDEIFDGISPSTIFINEYLAHGIHFFLLYFLIFGLSPYYLFSKLNLTNSGGSYVAVGDLKF